MSRNFQMFSSDFGLWPEDREDSFCGDCKLSKEKEQGSKLWCVLCERAHLDHMKETG